MYVIKFFITVTVCIPLESSLPSRASELSALSCWYKEALFIGPTVDRNLGNFIKTIKHEDIIHSVDLTIYYTLSTIFRPAKVPSEFLWSF